MNLKEVVVPSMSSIIQAGVLTRARAVGYARMVRNLVVSMRLANC